ncbi:MAG: Minf_1886 family protein [Candidatus Omnitrophota bacterium]
MGSFYNRIEKICEKDRRYKADSYEFVMQALNYTQSSLKKKGHVSGGELLEGIRKYGMEQFGPLAKTVFEHWGVRETEDFGEIVFQLVDNKILNKTDGDSIDDFRSVYNFEDVFKDDITDAGALK